MIKREKNNGHYVTSQNIVQRATNSIVMSSAFARNRFDFVMRVAVLQVAIITVKKHTSDLLGSAGIGVRVLNKSTSIKITNYLFPVPY